MVNCMREYHGKEPCNNYMYRHRDTAPYSLTLFHFPSYPVKGTAMIIPNHKDKGDTVCLCMTINTFTNIV